jgi:2-(1,2-epoxy-1,2-dihydrophenyl)acetyl-CoA isomerase
MGLAISTKSFLCTIDDGLAHIVLDRPERGNPIDEDFCREFNFCIAELSERADVRAVLLSARGRLFSVGGDLLSLVKQGDALPITIKAWTADLHTAIARMVRMRAPVVASVDGNVAGGSVSLMAAADLVVMAESARITAAFSKIGFSPDSGSTTTVTRRIGIARARRFFLLGETLDAKSALSLGLVDFVVSDSAVQSEATRLAKGIRRRSDRSLWCDQAPVLPDVRSILRKPTRGGGADARRNLANSGRARRRQGVRRETKADVSGDLIARPPGIH